MTGLHTFEGWGAGQDGQTAPLVGGAGGIGGGYALGTINLNAGDTVTITVGVHNQTGTSAGDSKAVKGTTICLAPGGGSPSTAVGTITHTGGNGGNNGGGAAGGGGGGGAGENGDGSPGGNGDIIGNPGTGGTGGATTGGRGGDGGNSNSAGQNGASLGGGGGGNGANAGASSIGGPAQLKVSW